MGNLLCRLEPTVEGGTPIFLCAHLDTVPPSGPIEPVVEDGVVRNAAGTILGAADKSAVVAMLGAARRVVDWGLALRVLRLPVKPEAGVRLLRACEIEAIRVV